MWHFSFSNVTKLFGVFFFMCMSLDYAIVIVLIVPNVYIQKWTKICILYIFLNPLINS